MNVQCGICKDIIDVTRAGQEGFKVSALSCGHVFHANCINRWLDQSGSSTQGTCPQCRCVTVKKKALRLFFDLVPMENYQDDPTVIKANNDLMKKEIEDLQDQVAVKAQLHEKVTKVNSVLRQRLVELEQKLVSAEHDSTALKLTRVKLNKKSKELENALDEVEKLRKNITSLRATNTILNGSLKDDEAKEALEALEKSDMALLFFSYKKDSEQLLKRVGKVTLELSKSQEETRKLRKELDAARDEISILNRIKDVYHKPKLMGSESKEVFTSSVASSPVVPQVGKPATSSFTPKVITPNKRFLVSKVPYKIPTKNSNKIDAKRLPIPETYDGLGGHSRPDDFPKFSTLKRKLR